MYRGISHLEEGDGIATQLVQRLQAALSGQADSRSRKGPVQRSQRVYRVRLLLLLLLLCG